MKLARLDRWLLRLLLVCASLACLAIAYERAVYQRWGNDRGANILDRRHGYTTIRVRRGVRWWDEKLGDFGE